MGKKEGELMSVDPIFWLLAAIGFVVLEAMTLNLVSIWFGINLGLISFCVSHFKMSINLNSPHFDVSNFFINITIL